MNTHKINEDVFKGKKVMDEKQKLILVFKHLLQSGLISKEEFNEVMKLILKGNYDN